MRIEYVCAVYLSVIENVCGLWIKVQHVVSRLAYKKKITMNFSVDIIIINMMCPIQILIQTNRRKLQFFFRVQYQTIMITFHRFWLHIL